MTGISWLLTGVILLLVCLFSALIVGVTRARERISRAKPLRRKAACLSAALESGARIGVGMVIHHAQLQAMLEGSPGSRASVVCRHR
ncbi:hypothetical protein ACNKHQ_23730 [Shigella flexneri]